MTTPNPEEPEQPLPRTAPPSGPINLSPTAELTALAAHLRRLSDRIEHLHQLDNRVDELSEALTRRILPQLVELRTSTADQLAAHADQVQRLIDTATATPGGGPVDWAKMDADQAASEWESLAQWIEHTLAPWYEITREQLPDCWALHRPAVMELAWLHNTYQAAHRADAEAHLAAEWHTRWRPAALRSIREAIPRRGTRVCGPGHHLVNEAERLRRHAGGGRAVHYPSEPILVPAGQPAERRYWQQFYDQAVTTDLARRPRSGTAGSAGLTVFPA